MLLVSLLVVDVDCIYLSSELALLAEWLVFTRTVLEHGTPSERTWRFEFIRFHSSRLEQVILFSVG